MSRMDLHGKRVVVVGLQASGRAAAKLAVSRGAQVVGADLRADIEPLEGVVLELGPHRRSTFQGADLIVVSPGVPISQPDLVAAEECGVPILGELAFAAQFLDLPTAAISGTNGKSTVTWFTGQLLRGAGGRPFVGGNLGNPLSNAVLAMDRGEDAPDSLVVEVSSYQMERPGRFHPQVGVILNLTPDHLARHGDMDTYGAMKVRLFAQMGPRDFSVLPADDDRLRTLAEVAGDHGRRLWLDKIPGVTRLGQYARVVFDAHEIRFDLTVVRVPGVHNLDNAATAALIAVAMGAPGQAIQEAMGSLEALPHRMQVVAEQDGVLWVNDSKATNVEAAAVGIGGIERPSVVLLGGQAKGPGFAALAPLLQRHRAVVTFGDSGPDIAAELTGAGVEAHRAGCLEDAVEQARGLARPGDAVLLSPGCASFDAFDDFEHRGRVFSSLAAGEDA
ncbi:MAG: UDP-N-acetylmuramoyl-L-alanine--D-glutamate ligase [Deltaproteobacteria bacterium]|nr:UDP-N-acetylmuramoyl-L-alanine--D-glutamate ligase [Deltaproteobacteria bacterium]